MKVIIIKRFPRYDLHEADPIIKRKLSNFANNAYDQCWLEGGSPQNIQIVNLSLGCENSPYLKEIIFGNPGLRYADGIHLSGGAASRHLTYQAVKVIKPLIISHPVQTSADTNTDSHSNCPCPAPKLNDESPDNHKNCNQAQYWGQSWSGSRERNTEQFTVPRRKGRSRGNRNENVSYKYGSNIYSVPVKNRFSENC